MRHNHESQTQMPSVIRYVVRCLVCYDLDQLECHTDLSVGLISFAILAIFACAELSV